MQKLILLGFGLVLLFSLSECARLARDADEEEGSDISLAVIKKHLEEYADIGHEKIIEAFNKIKENVNKEKFEEIVGKAKEAIASRIHGSSSDTANSE